MEVDKTLGWEKSTHFLFWHSLKAAQGSKEQWGIFILVGWSILVVNVYIGFFLISVGSISGSSIIVWDCFWTFVYFIVIFILLYVLIYYLISK